MIEISLDECERILVWFAYCYSRDLVGKNDMEIRSRLLEEFHSHSMQEDENNVV